MVTIEERAKEYADNYVVGDSAMIVDLLHKVAEESYLKGATEQKVIDDDHLREVKKMVVDKACEWLYKNILCMQHDSKTIFLARFRKAMED